MCVCSCDAGFMLQGGDPTGTGKGGDKRVGRVEKA
jgi:cyclophilin family peptidyl-prolyl cis-trans isomerase